MAEKFDYVAANRDAKELIAEFGQTMKLSKPGGSGEQSFTGVLLDLSFKDKAALLAVGAEARVLTADALKTLAQ